MEYGVCNYKSLSWFGSIVTDYQQAMLRISVNMIYLLRREAIPRLQGLKARTIIGSGMRSLQYAKGTVTAK